MNEINFINKNKDQTADWGDHHSWTWNDINSHWRRIGDPSNRPIVFLHGFGANSSHWRNNAYFFAKSGYCVYAIDLVGFGYSEQPEVKKVKFLDNVFWCNQVANFLKEIVLSNKKYQKAIIIGNSLGGLVALTVNFLYPNLIDSIISAPLPDPAFINKPINKKFKYILKIKSFLVKVFFRLLPLEILLPLINKLKLIESGLQFAYSKNISKDSELKRIIKTPVKRSSAPRALRAMCIGMSLRPQRYTAPSMLREISENESKPSFLLIWGRYDKLIPLNIGESLVNQYPWIKLKIIENSGHCPHDESYEQFNNSVLQWLKNKLKP
mgnify:CR=1 FL=1